ncbi:MAG: TerB family tellurite resistance protein, partial [Gammaproteobacteria bacterium]|nr:TerB family tellurite resistance protein [Gammaproteobacteria bacterium]
NMWRVAFSDERLDKYEEHLIRKIADLIYVSHSDFIKSKLKVRNDDS